MWSYGYKACEMQAWPQEFFVAPMQLVHTLLFCARISATHNSMCVKLLLTSEQNNCVVFMQLTKLITRQPLVIVDQCVFVLLFVVYL